MDSSIQTMLNKLVDEHYDEILDRLATKVQEASSIPIVDYNSLKHQAVLMQYVWEGVHQIQAVRPESYLAAALELVEQAVNRANNALQTIEDTNAQISSAEQQRVLDETARANAENARASAEALRASAEALRAEAEIARGLAEQDREDAEQDREDAETARSSWFNTFRTLVESWYSNPNDGTGVLERWNTFKSNADTWISQKQSEWGSFFGATAESEGGVRKTWNTWLASVQAAYQTFTNTMRAAEQARSDAEANRNSAEKIRQANEADRNSAETSRASAENLRNTDEANRNSAEQIRQANEGSRISAENLRDTAEGDRKDAEQDREDAEVARQTAYSQLLQNMQNLYLEMLTRASHPAQFGADGYIYEYDLATEQYVKTDHFWQKLERFRISKEFASIALMEAYDPESLPAGEMPLEKFDFVLIKSTPADPDNSKLYSYMGESDDPDYERWHYLGDFSGAMGFEGKTPQFSIGTVLAGTPGTQPEVTITANGTDVNGNPCFLINFTIPRGADGRGLSSLQQVQRSNTSDGENIWRATFTDGATADFIVLNGSQGANAGIGEATASIDDGIGTPSVTINTGGTNANRIFSFVFHNLKGATFTPSVDANGNLSWSNNGGLQNPPSFNIISALPAATQLQQGLMSATDKEKLDNSLSLATNQVADLTAADAAGKTMFWGSQDTNGKWTLQKMAPKEMQKLAYAYIKESNQIQELVGLLGVNNKIPKLTIADYTTAGVNYTPFASVSSSSTSRYKDCTVLISGAGNYYSNGLTGTWLVEMRSSTSGVVSMDVRCIAKPNAGSTVKFGYYTADGVTYFCIHSTSRRGEFNVTTLMNNSNLFTIAAGTPVTAAPTGWTEATTKMSLHDNDFTANNKGTSVDKILVTDASNGLGYSTPSDLASVLGVGENHDCNNISNYVDIGTLGYGFYAFTYPTTLKGRPSEVSSDGVILVFRWPYYPDWNTKKTMSILFDVYSGALWTRHRDEGSWKKV